jgi:hypothetical protein
MKTILLVLVVGGTFVVGCGGGNTQTKKSKDPRLEKRDKLLAQLKEHQQELDKAHFRFIAVSTNYERDKDSYQKKLTLAMAAKKATGKQLKDLEEKRGQLARMIQDRDRVGEELKKSYEALSAAQKKRNAAAVSLLETEGKLWELEEKAGGGRLALQKKVAGELEEMRKTGDAVRDADKARGDAASAVINKEVEVSGLIGADVQKRDEADQALDKLRDTLEGAVTAYVGAFSIYDSAKDKYHKRVLELLPKGPTHDKVQQLLDQRTNAAKLFDESQNVVKTATIDRAAQMKQRIAFDSEIDHVVEVGLTLATKQQVIGELKKETDSIAKGRSDMQTEDNSALAWQRKIAETEADLNKLGY